MNSGWRTALIDVLFILLLLLPHFPEPETEEDSTPPGTITVEIHWPSEMNTDIDLWVLAPGDATVGYSAKSGRVFNLLRDDLGHLNDIMPLNYENAYTRGSPAGEYVVNLHLYSTADPPPVSGIVLVSRRVNGSTVRIFTKTVILTKVGQELTVTRFTLDKNGVPVRGSFHDFPKALRG